MVNCFGMFEKPFRKRKPKLELLSSHQNKIQTNEGLKCRNKITKAAKENLEEYFNFVVGKP